MNLPKSLMRRIKSVLGRWRLLLIVLAASLLSGCVNYDVGVTFDSPQRGEIIQHIKLGERLTSFSGDAAREWLNSIERRTRQLEGKVKKLSNEELVVTIPFNNGADLETKFNQFFNPVDKKSDVPSTLEELPTIDSHLSLKQNNFLLLLRNKLSYDLDLRSLSLISTNNSVLVSPGSILELAFSLNTPWGARSIEKADSAIHPEIYQKGRQLLWTLKPGQLNHVEAVFWLPSPIGIGTLLIILFVVLGIYLRYKFMPDPRTIQVTRSAVPESN